MAVLSPALDPAQPTGLLQGGRFDERNEDLAVVNPYTGEEIARVAVGGPEDVDVAVAEATRAISSPVYGLTTARSSLRSSKRPP